MANDEASFKQEFRKALRQEYGATASIWTHTDMMRSGLPDIGAHYDGVFYPIEAKFVARVPRREESLVLCHELSAIQAAFLKDIQDTGGCPIILIGFADIAVAVPYTWWPHEPGGALEPNLSMACLQRIRSRNLAFEKRKGKWDVGGFFEASKRENDENDND